MFEKALPKDADRIFCEDVMSRIQLIPPSYFVFRFRITHLADPFYPDPQTTDDYYDDEDDVGVGLRESGGKESMSQEQVMEMLKMHERLLYTILATIGIPLVIIIIFYIEVG